MKYIVLLRGINISGKNKISMNELKAGLEKIGFENVSTYLNSGNAIFQSEIDNNTLAALTLLIAESNPKEKDVIIDLVMNFLNN